MFDSQFRILQQEIVDETDIYEDVNTGLRRGGPRVDVANFLAMFEHKLNHFQVTYLEDSPFSLVS